MHLGLQAQTAHADGFAHILAVNHKFLRLDQQQALIGGNIDRLGRLNHPRHIGLGNILALDRHHATRIEAANMAAGDAGKNAADLAVSHQLGFFQRLLDALDRGVDVDDHAALEPVAGGKTQTGQLELATGHDFGHHDHDLARPNVQPDNQILIFFRHIPTFFYLLRPCRRHPRWSRP